MKLLGKLVEFPELRFTPTGVAVSTFRLDLGDKIQECEAWEDLAEQLADDDLNRGDTLAVVGAYRMRSWQTREGERRSIRVLTVRDYRYRKDSRGHRATG